MSNLRSQKQLREATKTISQPQKSDRSPKARVDQDIREILI
jgi:hypothetical protein